MSEHGYINRGFGPSKIHVNPVGNMLIGPGINPDVIQDSRGLFRRTQTDIAAVGAVILSSPGQLDIEDYQLWAQDSWKEEHGSVEAAHRFSVKLCEEHEEFGIALIKYLRQPSDALRDDLISEAGDVLWCTTSVLSNANQSLKSSLQNYLHSLVRGTIVYEGETLRYPRWRTYANQLAIKNLEPLMTSDINALFDIGYVPQESTVMMLDDEGMERENSLEELYSLWGLRAVYAFSLRNLAHRQFGVHEVFGDDEQFRDNRSVEEFGSIGTLLSEVGSFIVMDTLYTTRQATGATFGQIVQKNYKKLSQRVAADLVDHTDGTRPDDLK